MTHLTILVSLLLICIGEAAGETTCGLHILEDAEGEATMGERLFHFLFFPYTSPEKVEYKLCDTPPSHHWLYYWAVWTESLSNWIANMAEAIRIMDINARQWYTPAISTFIIYNFTFVFGAYYALWLTKHYARKTCCKETCGHSKRKKIKCRKEVERRDKLRLLKAQRTKSGILPRLIHLHKANHGINNLVKLEVNGQTHTSYRHPVFPRLGQKYSVDKLPSYILKDMLDADTLQQKKHAVQNKRENSFKDAREETLETLLKQKYIEDGNQTSQSIQTEVSVGGGGDFVGGTTVPNIGRPCASSSFISTFDPEVIESVEVDSDGEEFIIEYNGNLSQGSSNVRRRMDQGNGSTDGSSRQRELRDNSWTQRSFSDWRSTFPSYLPNTPNDTFATSFDAGTDRSMVYDDTGDESALMTTMMDSFVSVSDSLQKTSTWYGSDDMEASLFQWLSAVVVTRRLAEKAWMFLFGHPRPTPVYTFPQPRAASPTPESASSPPFSPPYPQEYYPDFESELPRYQMVD